jgi:hypothetical protein
MTRRLIKRNAHACTTIAGAWLLFSLFAVLDWRDAHRHLGDPNAVVNYGIWGFQLLFIFFAVYFHRTETPREVLWFGDTKGYASGFIRINDVTAVFKQLASLVPELTDTEIEKIIILAREPAAQGEGSTTIPIIFRGRSEQLFVSFEVWENDILELHISTHLDLSDEIDKVLAPYQDEIDVP